MPIYSPTGFLDITNATLRTSNVEAENLLMTGGNIYVTSELETDATVLNLENVTRKGNVSSNTIEITNATTGIVATGNVQASKFIGSGEYLTGIPPSAITGTLSQWSDGTNGDVYIAGGVGIANAHTLTSNTLQVGGNLYVRDTGSNVLTVDGNVVANYFEGDGSKLSGIVTDLQGVTDNGNTTTNVVQFSNVTTGLVTTANIEVGGDLKIDGLSAGKIPYVGADKFLKDSFITTTGDTTVITSNLDVTGNIFMRGDKFIVHSESKLINDAIVGIANNNTVSTTDKGIIMQNTTGNVAIIHHGTGDGFADQLTFGYTDDPLDTVTVTNDLTKELTVNVLGNVITQNNLSVGGTLSINNITAAAQHSLQAVTNVGNVTSNTVQFSNAITSLTASSNIVVTGNVSAGHDTNTTSFLGRAAIGYMGQDDQASFAHVDHNDPARYAIKQTAAGPTYINTPAAGHIRFTVNDGNAGAEKMRITSAGRVGVGVTSPDATLHVAGNAYVSSNLTVSGNVSDLNIVSNVNMLHTANTAAIKLNSNVVTEFPRSKKFIKYPRVAMTGQTTSNHTVTASGWYGSGANYEPWKAFDNVGNHSSGQLAWYSFDHPAPEAYSGTDYAFNPNHGGTATPVLFTGAVQGEWLKIQLPDKIALDHYIMYGPNQEREFPRDWTVYGSVDGTNWNWIDSRVSQIFGDGTGSGGTATGKRKEFYLDTPTNEYLYFGFVFTRGSVNRDNYIGIGELELYGVPEYDPEAHGTDVTLKSLTNVPNTDWLEVYYDAKNYTSGVVQDETTNNRDAEMNATFDNGEIKAFSFSGAYTSNVTTSDHGLGTGDVTYTMSYWFKRTAVAGTYDYVVMLGNGGVSYSSILMWINANQLVLDHWSAALRVPEPIKLNKWYHVAAGHKGGDTPSLENDFIYIDGKKVTPEITQTAAPFTLAGSKLTLGSEHNGTTEFLNGKIANFRLFNRALSSDEIYQLYAYQKEYFGHGDLSMTLKAGRLGIGTSEPKAALDVRGDVEVGGLITSTTKSASGGTESMVGSDRLHQFTTAGMFSVTGADISVEFLIIGGGGGGGRNHGGGGGGGQFVSGTITLPRGVYPIMVGRGGLGGYQPGSNENPGQTGGESRALGFIARGGGGGGTRNGYVGSMPRGYEGLDGGCGGGGAGTAPDGSTVDTAGGYGAESLGIMLGTTQAATNTFGGYGGGKGKSSVGGSNAGNGGGGGGAGGQGGNATGQSSQQGVSGNGGVGLASSITGTSVTYAGGGSGGRWSTGSVGTTNGGGGTGGAADYTAGNHGTNGLGGGGGGGGGGNGAGGNGGDGIVILRWTP